MTPEEYGDLIEAHAKDLGANDLQARQVRAIIMRREHKMEPQAHPAWALKNAEGIAVSSAAAFKCNHPSFFTPPVPAPAIKVTEVSGEPSPARGTLVAMGVDDPDQQAHILRHADGAFSRRDLERLRERDPALFAPLPSESELLRLVLTETSNREHAQRRARRLISGPRREMIETVHALRRQESVVNDLTIRVHASVSIIETEDA